ncbi:citrulline utilization hydrolase CtlX [Shewanella salipaludis]|uniref:Amidinotransferase n=1 Tax=Shewanella salipaludis TaxID=2723052 RepID=A0A972FZC7_9GAMM|nr:arginine deiminase-related protein [Shewanella salipaludis]NMH65983.1 amidinotransferase [Shewanella salipaludis]
MARSAQAPGVVVMIRPHHFSPNPQTAPDNAFQQTAAASCPSAMASRAYDEVTRAATTLREHGIDVRIFEDEGRRTPDSVFPNNWFSTHSGGRIAIYPMYPHNRRHERRADIIAMLKGEFRVRELVDYSGLEQDGIFLEGTGAMVLDHVERVAYAVQSNRTHPLALERFCSHFNYEPMLFQAMDAGGKAVYHTNVLMCIASEFVMIGLELIRDPCQRAAVRRRIEASGRLLIELSATQIANFAANAIELQAREGAVLALSVRALASLTPEQLGLLERSVTPLPLDVATIELAGGSVRCMLAGIHLSPR